MRSVYQRGVFTLKDPKQIAAQSILRREVAKLALTSAPDQGHLRRGYGECAAKSNYADFLKQGCNLDLPDLWNATCNQ
jgi:hypothetical protein